MTKKGPEYRKSLYAAPEMRGIIVCNEAGSIMQDKIADIHHEDTRGVRVIELCARIDIHNVFAVEETLTGLIDETHDRVIIDFSRIEYFGSNGIRLLMLAKRKLDHFGGHLVLVNMSPFVIKILKAIDLYELFSIMPDRATALESLAR